MSIRLIKALPGLMLLSLVACAPKVAVQEPGAAVAAQADATQATAAATASETGLTPAENNDIAVQMFEGAWNKGDFTVIDKLIKADAIDHSPLGSEKGSEGFKAIIGMFRGAMPDLKMSIEDEIYSGDRVVHSWKIQGKHTGAPLFGVPPSDKDLTLTGITIVRIEDGKIAERWTQLDQLGLLQQLGVIPPANKPS
jgi:steroid delta-isomerase-like uncharacterized protein